MLASRVFNTTLGKLEDVLHTLHGFKKKKRFYFCFVMLCIEPRTSTD